VPVHETLFFLENSTEIVHCYKKTDKAKKLGHGRGDSEEFWCQTILWSRQIIDGEKTRILAQPNDHLEVV
jgi:hypothetical protein